MQIYPGSSNPSLAQSLANQLGLRLSAVEFTRFESDEVRAYVPGKVESEVVVVQSLSQSADRHLMELLMLVDALSRGGAKKITAVIPYLGYSRQNQIFRPGESLSAAVVAKLLGTSPISLIITVDIHDPKLISYYSIPVINLPTASLFASVPLSSGANVIAPDHGAALRAGELARLVGAKRITLNKSRDRATNRVEIVEKNVTLVGQEVIICDDSIASGQTLVRTLALLKDNRVGKIQVCVTHHLGVVGVADRLASTDIDQIFITNSVVQATLPGKFQVLDLAPLLAQTLSKKV